MKQLTLFFTLFTSIFSIQGQSITGAWETTSGVNKMVLLVTDNYLTCTEYGVNPAEFRQTWGGLYQITDKEVLIQVEFNSNNAAAVGKPTTISLKVVTNTSVIFDGKNYTRIDDGSNTDLFGGWQITQRATPIGEMQAMKPGARKTLKVLSGTRFQWIAMNTATGEFSGTGGGTYTLENGIYAEQIEFFSRDNSRVGASLSFEAEVTKTDWLHTGKSSKGQPIKEIWSKIK